MGFLLHKELEEELSPFSNFYSRVVKLLHPHVSHLFPVAGFPIGKIGLKIPFFLWALLERVWF